MVIGRPTDYNADLAAEICQRISDGNSLRRICKADDMPNAATIYKWIGKYPAFNEQYARACVDRADAIFEEAIEIADDSANDFIETEDGQKLNSEHVQRSRLRVDTRKWFVSKLNPKKYGEKVQTEHTGADGGPIITKIVREVVRPTPSSR